MSVRELKNRTAQILRGVEAGERVIVTKRGHPVAVIEPLSEAPAPVLDSIYQRLKRQNEARTPGLSGHSKAAITRDFERISRKGARVIFLIGIGAKWIGWPKVIGLAFSDSDLFVVDLFQGMRCPVTRDFLLCPPSISPQYLS